MLWINKITYQLCRVKLINSFERYVYIWALILTSIILWIKHLYFESFTIYCWANGINKDILTYITAIYWVILSFVWVSWPLIVGSTEYKSLLKGQNNTLYWNNYVAILRYLRTTFFAILFSVLLNIGIFFIESNQCIFFSKYITVNFYWIIFYFNILWILFFIRYIDSYFQIEENANSN